MEGTDIGRPGDRYSTGAAEAEVVAERTRAVMRSDRGERAAIRS